MRVTLVYRAVVCWMHQFSTAVHVFLHTTCTLRRVYPSIGIFRGCTSGTLGNVNVSTPSRNSPLI